VRQQPRRRDLNSPEEYEALRSLANPIRQKILRSLSRGPANSTTLAKELGESTGTTSYHLRQLAKLDFIEEVTEGTNRRERWWRSLPQDIRMVDVTALPPDLRLIHDQWEAQKIANDMRLMGHAIAERAKPGTWVRGSRWGTWLTKDELDQFVEEYLELIGRYGHDSENAPPGARAVAVRMFAVPEPPPDTSEPTAPAEPVASADTAEPGDTGKPPAG
jgi:DNA-binding transcriptional ArsR family regulator